MVQEYFISSADVVLLEKRDMETPVMPTGPDISFTALYDKGHSELYIVFRVSYSLFPLFGNVVLVYFLIFVV